MIKAHNDVFAAVRSLPQSKFIPEARIHHWINRVSLLEDGKPLSFHVNRLFGVGGSESGSILAHYHDSASTAKLEDGFKSADTISREKLLLAAPFTTEYAERGTLIEPVISDIFCRKFDLFDKVDHQAMEAAKSHSTNQFMKANTDSVFFKEKRILVDYKSISRGSYQGNIPFTHISQINHYAENMRSNSFGPDVSLTANLVAEESIFRDIISAYDNREENPQDYLFWVNAIIKDQLSSVKLIIKPIQTNPEFGQMLSETISRFMHEYPLAGKTISAYQENTALIGDEILEASKIEARMFSLLTAEKSIANIKNTFHEDIEEFANKVGKPFEWPGRFPVSLKFEKKINKEAAIKAIELSGMKTDLIYTSSNSIDETKLLERFINIGGELEDSLYLKKIDDERLEQAIKDAGLDINDFTEKLSTSVKLSRKNQNADQKDALSFEITDALSDLLIDKADEELNQIEDLNNSNSQSPTMQF